VTESFRREESFEGGGALEGDGMPLGE